MSGFSDSSPLKACVQFIVKQNRTDRFTAKLKNAELKEDCLRLYK
jgi:hypothetical protein